MKLSALERRVRRVSGTPDQWSWEQKLELMHTIDVIVEKLQKNGSGWHEFIDDYVHNVNATFKSTHNFGHFFMFYQFKLKLPYRPCTRKRTNGGPTTEIFPGPQPHDPPGFPPEWEDPNKPERDRARILMTSRRYYLALDELNVNPKFLDGHHDDKIIEKFRERLHKLYNQSKQSAQKRYKKRMKEIENDWKQIDGYKSKQGYKTAVNSEEAIRLNTMRHALAMKVYGLDMFMRWKKYFERPATDWRKTMGGKKKLYTRLMRLFKRNEIRTELDSSEKTRLDKAEVIAEPNPNKDISEFIPDWFPGTSKRKPPPPKFTEATLFKSCPYFRNWNMLDNARFAAEKQPRANRFQLLIQKYEFYIRKLYKDYVDPFVGGSAG
jgi:hypothetical protein